MPYQVSWQSVSIKSQRPVHVLASAALASTPQQAPAAARIVAAKMPSLVMAVPPAPTWTIVTWNWSWQFPLPCPNLDHRDLEDVGCKTHSNLGEKFRS